MFLWRSLSPAVLLSVLTRMAGPAAEPSSKAAQAEAPPVSRLADRQPRGKA